MVKKRVYFVRHGETNSNKAMIVQGLHDELSDTGRRQAAQVATRFENIDFQALLASDAVRAQETAQAIAGATGQEVIAEALFREVKKPASFEGTSNEVPEFQAFLKAEAENIDNPSWQYEDAEHFHAAVSRATAAIELLEKREEEAIAVVSHGYFLRFVAAVMMTNKNLTTDWWKALQPGRQLHMSNTGITLCEYDGVHWSIITWNDHAHFAE